MGTVTELAHTADVGFEITADGLGELFELAADGLAAARGAAADAGTASGPRDVAMERPDLERLLVAWLRELHYRSVRDDAVASASVREVSAAPGDGSARLRALVSWRPAADAPEREIKGVTYHGLAVRRGGEGQWHARVVLDV